MDYLRIEEDGQLLVVRGKDPEDDEELLQEVADGTLDVIRYRGHDFQQLIVEELTEDEDDAPDFEVSWLTLVEEAE